MGITRVEARRLNDGETSMPLDGERFHRLVDDLGHLAQERALESMSLAWRTAAADPGLALPERLRLP